MSFFLNLYTIIDSRGLYYATKTEDVEFDANVYSCHTKTRKTQQNSAIPLCHCYCLVNVASCYCKTQTTTHTSDIILLINVDE